MYDDFGFGKWGSVRLTVELRDELERTEMALKEFYHLYVLLDYYINSELKSLRNIKFNYFYNM